MCMHTRGQSLKSFPCICSQVKRGGPGVGKIFVPVHVYQSEHDIYFGTYESAKNWVRITCRKGSRPGSLTSSSSLLVCHIYRLTYAGNAGRILRSMPEQLLHFVKFVDGLLGLDQDSCRVLCDDPRIRSDFESDPVFLVPEVAKVALIFNNNFNPFTPKFKNYILPTFLKRNVLVR